MIFDWTYNCEQMIKNKHITEESSSDRSCMDRQELVLMKYLKQVKEYSKEQVYDLFQEIDNTSFKNESDQQYEFDLRWTSCERLTKLIEFDTKRYCYDINIYQEEIDIINNQTNLGDTERKLLLVLLAWTKFNKGRKIILNKKLSSWIKDKMNLGVNYRIWYEISHRCGVFYMGPKSLNIAEAPEGSNRLVEITLSYYVSGSESNDGNNHENDTSKYQLTFLKKTGTLIANIHSPEEIFEHLDLVRVETYCCSKCHREYLRSVKSKTDMCPECYEEYRKEYKEAKNKVEKICTECGTIFKTSTKSKTDLCPDCYKQYRTKYTLSRRQPDNRTSHHGSRLQYLTCICPLCNKTFETTSRSKTDLCPECYKIQRRQYNTQKKAESRKKSTDVNR